MALDPDHPAVRDALPRLAPYGRGLVEDAGREALRLFADAVGPEHVLVVLMADEDCAAHRAVLAAFADPETIGQEALALCEGILVVGSTGALPFSTGAVGALRAARARAAERGAAELDGDQLLAAAARALGGDGPDVLAAAGFRAAALEPDDGGRGLDPAGPLFRDTTEEARRVLSQSARLAAADGCDAISAAHVVIAALEDPERGRRAGLAGAAARRALLGRTRDDAPPPARRLPPSAELEAYLAALPDGAGSLALLAEMTAERWPEPAALLARHRVTADWVARAAGGFRDPD